MNKSCISLVLVKQVMGKSCISHGKVPIDLGLGTVEVVGNL